jgi:hypothetical protein
MALFGSGSEPMTVKEIIKQYLLNNNYDGLAGEECGCTIDDLMPCEFENLIHCEPGYKRKCDCGDGCDFHISTKKE